MLHLDNFLLFIVHLLIALFYIFLCHESGNFVIQFLFHKKFHLRDNYILKLIFNIGIGVAAFQILFTVFLTYFPYYFLKIVIIAFLTILTLNFLYRIVINKESRLVNKKLLLLFISIFFLTFLIAYLPFLGASKYFLASEGGGDHTIYLGATNIYQNLDLNNLLQRPWIQTLSFNRSIIQNFPDFHTFISKFLDMNYLQKVQLKFNNLELIELGLFESNYLFMHKSYSPSYWALNWFLSNIFNQWVPNETTYMTMLLTHYSLVIISIVFALYVNLKLSKFFSVLVYWGVIASAAFFGIFIHHYVCQSLSVLMNIVFWIYFISEINNKEWNLNQDIFVMVIYAGATLASYFVNCVFFAAIIVGYVYSRWSIFYFEKDIVLIFKNFKLYFIGLVFSILLIPNYILQLAIFLDTLFPIVKVSKETMMTYFGEKVSSLEEAVPSLLGVVHFHFLNPYTMSNLKDFMIGKQYLIIGIAIFFLFLFVYLLSFFPKIFKTASSENRKPMRMNLVMMSLIFLSIYFTKYSKYTFFKSTLMAFPFLVLVTVYSLEYIRTTFKLTHRFILVVVCITFVWIFSLTEVRVHQIVSFWKGVDRAEIVYSDVKETVKKMNPSRLFYYPVSNTSFSLLETILTGQNAYSATQGPKDSYKKLITGENISKAVFVIPTANKKQYSAISNNQFFVSDDRRSFVWPFSPFIDFKKTVFPTSIYLDRIGYLELAIRIEKAPITLIVFSNSNEFSYKALINENSNYTIETREKLTELENSIPVSAKNADVKILDIKSNGKNSSDLLLLRLNQVQGVICISEQKIVSSSIMNEMPHADLQVIQTAGDLQIHWKGLATPTLKDWMGLFPTKGNDDSRINFARTNGQAEGSLTLKIPSGLSDGKYEIRLYRNDSWELETISKPFEIKN